MPDDDHLIATALMEHLRGFGASLKGAFSPSRRLENRESDRQLCDRFLTLSLYLSLLRPQQVNWVKVDDDVPSHAVITGADLYIENLNKSYNGTYRCVASNLVGESYDDYTLYVYGES